MNNRSPLRLKKLLPTLLVIALFACESCDLFGSEPKSELEKLPPATMEGKNTFGCLVNGKAWVTRTSTDVLAFYQSGVFQISAGIEETNRDQGITIVVHNGLTQGDPYDLSDDPDRQSRYGGTLPHNLCFYDDENTLSGNLTITRLDQINLVVSGLFEFTTVVAGCDTIKITNGRFDVLYAN